MLFRSKPRALSCCQVGVSVQGTFDDPDDLTYLQTSVAICRGLARLGAVAFFDVQAQRCWDGDDIFDLSPKSDFLIRSHIGIFATTHVTGHHSYTRGMRKFARPDVFLRRMMINDIQKVTLLLNQIAWYMAIGKVFDEKTVLRIPSPTTGGPLPPLILKPFPDDTDVPEPEHGYESNKFKNSSFQVVDFDEEEFEERTDARFFLSALRTEGQPDWQQASNTLGINFGTWQ